MTNLELWRLLMGVARDRQRLGLKMQRRRLVKSMVANETARRQQEG